MACRICLEPASNTEPFIQPCNCRGYVANVHKNCLQQWINIRKSPNCEICKSKYDITIVTIPCSEEHRYKLLGYILLGCASSLISCYGLWLQQLLDHRTIYNMVPTCVTFFCVLIQIITWFSALKNGNTYEFIFVPLIWLFLFLFVGMLLIIVSDLWYNVGESGIIFYGAISIHSLSSIMMSIISIYIKFRNSH